MTSGRWLAALLLMALFRPNNSSEESRVGYGALAGHVFDAEGAPVHNVIVWPEAVELVNMGPRHEFRTNENGQFLISMVPAGTHVILAYGLEEGYPDVRFGNFIDDLGAFPKVNVEEGKSTLGVVVRLGPSAGWVDRRLGHSAASRSVENTAFQN
ncbi:MAG: carboxypeptidase-like regulatory domain-containing protein [Acidobacteriota bacterium]